MERKKLARPVNFSLVNDSTIQQPGFNLPRQQWSLLNHFWRAQGHCGAGKKKWNQAATDLCPCGEKQTMSHIVDSCPLLKLNGGCLNYSLLMMKLLLGSQLWLLMHTQEEVPARSRFTESIRDTV